MGALPAWQTQINIDEEGDSQMRNPTCWWVSDKGRSLEGNSAGDFASALWHFLTAWTSLAWPRTSSNHFFDFEQLLWWRLYSCGVVKSCPQMHHWDQASGKSMEYDDSSGGREWWWCPMSHSGGRCHHPCLKNLWIEQEVFWCLSMAGWKPGHCAYHANAGH